MSQKNSSTSKIERKYRNAQKKYRASLSGNVLVLSSHQSKPPRQSIQDGNEPEQFEFEEAKLTRGIVTSFSRASRSRLIKYAREIEKDRFKSFITLTYPTAPDPITAKAHLDRIIQEIRRQVNPLDAPRRPVSSRQTRGDDEKISKMKAARAARTVPRRPAPPRRFSEKYELEKKSQEQKATPRKKRGDKKPTELSILWVMEFQERGAIHFHLWCSHFVGKSRLRLLWNRIIGEPIETPSTDVRGWKTYSKGGLGCYVAKYANKQMQKELPPELAEKGAGRWWGIIGNASRPLAISVEIDENKYGEIHHRFANMKSAKQIPHEWVGLFILEEKERATLFAKLQAIEREKLRKQKLKKQFKRAHEFAKKQPRYEFIKSLKALV